MNAPLLYFVPEGADYPAHARENGFRPAVKSATEGPGGKIGRLMTPCVGEFDLSHDPENQDWTEIDGVFIGVSRREKATPEMLARRELCRNSHPATLGDGQSWHIPVARLCSGVSALPSRRVIRNGHRAWAVDEVFRDLADFAERAWNLNNGVKVEIMDDEVDDVCARLLNLNYRIGVNEAVLMGLFSDGAQRAIMGAMIDLPTVERIVEEHKKKLSQPGI